MYNEKPSFITKYQVIGLLAVLIAIISIILTLNQNNKIEDLRYVDKALEYRPDLYSNKNHIIDLGEIIIEEIEVFQDNKIDSLNISLSCLLNVKGSISYRNIGNSKAIYIGLMCHDYNSNDLQLITTLLDSTNIQVKPIRKAPKEIRVGDSLNINFEHKIANSQNDQFTIHVMLLYKNELDNLFYTYHWAKYKIPPVPFRNTTLKEVSDSPLKPPSSLSFVSGDCFSGIFDKKEFDNVRKRLRSLEKN